MEDRNFPTCLKCHSGQLVPLSDYGNHGAAVHYKAWVCTSPDCLFNIKIRNGDVYVNELGTRITVINRLLLYK